ncbi:MAG: hypothetical protein AAFP13_09270 [Pseudomonadota bacterium]
MLLTKEPAELRTLLGLASAAMGFALWFPSLGIPAGPISLQPADLVALAALPIVLAYSATLPAQVWLLLSLSLCASFAAYLNGGALAVLLYYTVFLSGFVLLVAKIVQQRRLRSLFLRAFVLGAAASSALFLLQVGLGAESLDFRTNDSFSNPPQFGRGFAVFPEVSTFATHQIYFAGVAIVLLRATQVGRGLLSRPMAWVFLVLVLTCLAMSRSSSVIVVAPIVFAVAFMKGRALSFRNILVLSLAIVLTMVLLQVFLSAFYSDRVAGSALRSIYLRGITMLTGLSVIPNYEVLGVGLGNNDAVTVRAFEVARALNFEFILLPTGINSFVITRIFEEGWLAIVLVGTAITMLARVLLAPPGDGGSWLAEPTLLCFVVLALASFLVSLLVTGYRGIYMNWFWLGAIPALYARTVARRGLTRAPHRPRGAR